MPELGKYTFIKQALEERRAKRQFRTVTACTPASDANLIYNEDKKLLNFCSNDYLGLACHPKVVGRSRKFAADYGTGATASRLICGTFHIHNELEEKLAAAFDTEAALLFNSGFQANSSIVSTLTTRRSLILADKLCHSSLLQGALLSRATFQRFEHNNIDHLERLLDQASMKDYDRILVITESIFSMDGDRAPLHKISELAQRHKTLLFVDDAHAVGVWGKGGMGLANDIEGVDILLGTCGKAFGSFGSFVACSEAMRDYLVNFCPGFIYTTALPPAVIGSIDAALELIPSMEEERILYHRNITNLRSRLRAIGYDAGPSSSQIIPLITGSEQSALALSNYLSEQGIMVTAIRPPTVPQKSSRIRIALSTVHTKEMIGRLVNTLEDWKNAGR